MIISIANISLHPGKKCLSGSKNGKLLVRSGYINNSDTKSVQAAHFALDKKMALEIIRKNIFCKTVTVGPGIDLRTFRMPAKHAKKYAK